MKNRNLVSLTALLALILALTACGASQPSPEQPESDPAPLAEHKEQAAADTLASLCGEDYQAYLIDTLTMQMENRMVKTPDVVYFPIRDDKPLTDYAAIDETTAFQVNEKGHLVLTFPAGTLTDEANGAQDFIVPLPGQTLPEEDGQVETLASLCGEDYQAYLIDTLTMQMENRMVKTPDVVYFPIRDNKPLTDYTAIDETTAFTMDEEGHVVILFPAGTVTDEANGAQSFRVPRP